MREINLVRYEWNSEIEEGHLTFTVDGETKVLSGGFYRECSIEWQEDQNQKGEKFEEWRLDPYARDHLIEGCNFNLSYEEVNFLEERFNRKMNELSL